MRYTVAEVFVPGREDSPGSAELEGHAKGGRIVAVIEVSPHPRSAGHGRQLTVLVELPAGV